MQVLEWMSAAWVEMGPHARELYVIQHLEELVGEVVKSLSHVDVRQVHVLDSGDGSGLASYAATYPKMVSAVLRAVAQSTGVDIPAILAAPTAVVEPVAPPAPRGPTRPPGSAGSFGTSARGGV